MPHLIEDSRNQTAQPSLSYVVRFASDLRELQQQKSPAGFVSILPSVPKLWFEEYDYDRFQFAGGKAPSETLAVLLAGFLDQLKDQYDCVLMDCAPGFGSMTRAALMIADVIVAPTISDTTSIRSLGDFVDLGMQQRLGLSPSDKLRVIVSRFTATNSQKLALDQLRKQYNVVGSPIPMLDQVLAATEMLHGKTRSYADKYRWPIYNRLSTHVQGLSDALYRDIFRVEI